MTSLLLITPPSGEPLTLAEAKAHLRVEHAADDTLLTALIAAVRHACESHTGRALLTQGWRLMLDSADTCDDRAIRLPRAPLQQVTAVASLDESGMATPFSADNYYLDAGSKPGRLVLKDGASWPAILRRVAAIRIDYDAGYGAADDVPPALKQGMLQHIAALYCSRGDVMAAGSGMPTAALALYQPYRIYMGVA